ncbi:hydrolethalus syndrome protein 1 homolog [Coregonus clupeaformis]|uniref:hydrolethalus syndrome protein 1 homolog n=1 Tax=Coregonus clupeaformis TaxID=59861 RepID=UPI001E1C57D3|nr:hydrolethalus syndrome protein 1 homolog [Coregonus clupeaformis]
MENLDFSEDEIQQQLEALGYNNIPRHRLREFKRDLDELIRHEKSKSHSSSELNSTRSQSTTFKSPPAVTKVKVHQDNTTAFRNVFAQAGPSHHERQVLTSTYSRDNSNYGARQEYDSYTQHSVASKYQRPSTAPNRLEVVPDQTDLQQLSFAVSQSSTPDRDTGAHGRPFIKRKVLRKHQGQVHICDESTHSEDSGAVSGLEERLGSMSTHQESELESEDAGSLSDRSESDRLSSAFKAYIRGMARSRSESDIRPQPKSFIRPVMDHPHTKNLKKTDPVAKYFQYKQDWEMFKAPGEKDRKALHWEIREQLAYKPQPPKPQRIFVANTYVVPTEKKRSALRWEIRHDLANGLLPPTNYRL